jgi:hypothetical protein
MTNLTEDLWRYPFTLMTVGTVTGAGLIAWQAGGFLAAIAVVAFCYLWVGLLIAAVLHFTQPRVIVSWLVELWID